MKIGKSAIIICILAAFLFMGFLFSCGTASIRDNNEDRPVKVGTPPGPDDDDKNSKKTGGPEEIPVDSDLAMETFAFLKESLAISHPHIVLTSINKAFSQVVEGYVIILICRYTESGDNDAAMEPVEGDEQGAGENQGMKYLYARVYYDLEGKREITELILRYIPEGDK